MVWLTAILLIGSCGLLPVSSQANPNIQPGEGIAKTTVGYEDSPFGFHSASVYRPGYSDNGFVDAQNIGVRWAREGVYAFWFLIQPDLSKQVYDFSRHDKQWRDIPVGINILANIAPQGPIDEGYAHPDSYLPIDEAKYTAFVKATVERYDGDGIADMPGLTNPIKYWQVGNEQNNKKSCFADLQRITYLAIKEADPEATVIIGGVAGGPHDYILHFDAVYGTILDTLAGQYIDVMDFHWYGAATGDYRLKDTNTGEDVYNHIRSVLIANGFSSDLPIWITEMGSYSGDPSGFFPYQTEQQQASDYFKRYVYSLSRGIEKIFLAFGLIEGFKHDDGYFDHTGLIYDGQGSNDLGLSVKKLSYYTYKLMTEKLEYSGWNNIETIQESDNVYVYKFIKNDKDESIYVVWWDYFNDTGSNKTITLNVGNVTTIKLTEAVPDVEFGADLNEEDYPGFFGTKTIQVTNGTVTITLGENPVFVEGTSKESPSPIYVSIVTHTEEPSPGPGGYPDFVNDEVAPLPCVGGYKNSWQGLNDLIHSFQQQIQYLSGYTNSGSIQWVGLAEVIDIWKAEYKLYTS